MHGRQFGRRRWPPFALLAMPAHGVHANTAYCGLDGLQGLSFRQSSGIARGWRAEQLQEPLQAPTRRLAWRPSPALSAASKLPALVDITSLRPHRARHKNTTLSATTPLPAPRPHGISRSARCRPRRCSPSAMNASVSSFAPRGWSARAARRGEDFGLCSSLHPCTSSASPPAVSYLQYLKAMLLPMTMASPPQPTFSSGPLIYCSLPPNCLSS